jgi:hypothetical protein
MRYGGSNSLGQYGGYGASIDGIIIGGVNPAAGAFNPLTVGAAGSQALLQGDATDTLAQRRGVNPQALRIYNTFTDASNYERGVIDWNASVNVLTIGAQKAGTGTLRPISLVGAQIYFPDGLVGAPALARGNGASSGLWFDASSFLHYAQGGADKFYMTSNGFGYPTGVGGTVAQATNKSTGVTLSTLCGTITLNAASLAADTSVAFTLTNANIAATDCIVVLHDSVGTLGAYSFAVTPGAGSAVISVHNCTPGALAEAIVLRFAIIKAVIA